MAHGQLTNVIRNLRRLVTRTGAGAASDRELLERYADHKDESAFVALVERHGPLVLGVCRRLLDNDHDADDAFQATFLLLSRKAGSVQWHSSVTGWLYESAQRVARKARCQSAQRVRHEKQAAAVAVRTSPDQIEWGELRQVLDEEMLRLPTRFRIPLVLCYLQGKTRDEAAQELGWTVGAVKGSLERGREVLRSRLARRGLTLSAALLPTLLTPSAASAVPASLVNTTISTAVTGAVSAPVACLVKGAMQAMFWNKLKVVAILVVGTLVIGGGTGAVVYRAAAGDGEGAQASEENQAQGGRGGETQSEEKEKKAEPADKDRAQSKKEKVAVAEISAVPSGKPEEVLQGKITKVTVAAQARDSFVTVNIDGKDRSFTCSSAKFLDDAGKEIKEGIKSKLVKEGVEVTITTIEVVLSEGGQKSTHSHTSLVQLKKLIEDEDKEQPKKEETKTSPEASKTDNEPRLNVLFTQESQRFGISCTKLQDPLRPNKFRRLTRDERGLTNNTCTWVDAYQYLFGHESPGVRYVKEKGVTQREVKISDHAWQSIMFIEQSETQVTQVVEIVRGEQTGLLDTVKVTYQLWNRDGKAHKIGLRMMLDTFIGSQDGLPAYVPPVGKNAASMVDKKRTFEQKDIPPFLRLIEGARRDDVVAEMNLKLADQPPVPKKVPAKEKPKVDEQKVADLIKALDSDHFDTRVDASAALEKMKDAVEAHLKKALESGPTPEAKKRLDELVGKIAAQRPVDTEQTFAGKYEPLHQLVICRWPGNSEARWDWDYRDMDEGADRGREKDSCVVLYWDKKIMNANEKREFAFSYGLGRMPADQPKTIARDSKEKPKVDEQKVTDLIKALGSDDFETCTAAGTALEKMAESIAPQLKKALEQKPDVEAKKRLEELLAKIEAKSTGDAKLRLLTGGCGQAGGTLIVTVNIIGGGGTIKLDLPKELNLVDGKAELDVPANITAPLTWKVKSTKPGKFTIKAERKDVDTAECEVIVLGKSMFKE